MPAAAHQPPMPCTPQLRWLVAAMVVLALGFGVAWEMLALCEAVVLGLLLRQAIWGRMETAPKLNLAARPRLRKISLHLAIRDAPPERLGRTLQALAHLDYPDLEVLVVDSNTADPARWAGAAQHCARLGARFRFFALGPWPGGRAGALAFARTEMAPDAELIGVLRDGDAIDADWLRRAAPGFADARLGALAAPLRGTDATVLLVRAAALDHAGGWVPGFDAAPAELMLRLSGRGWWVLRSERSAGQTERRHAEPGEAPYRFGQMLRRHWRELLSGHGGATVPASRATAWLADAGYVATFALCLCWSVALAWSPRTVGFPPPAAVAPLLALPAMRAALAASRRGRAMPPMANAYEAGLAVWCGLLGITAAMPVMPRHARLLLLGLATIAVAARHPSAGVAEALWFLLVAAMALPDLVALRMRPALHRPRHLAAHGGTGD